MDTPAEVRPGIVLVAVRRRWRAIAAVTVFMGLVGLGLTFLQSPSYVATTAVFLNPLDGNPYSTATSTARNDQLASLETEAALVTTTAVGQLATEAAAGQLPESPQRNVVVTVPSNSQVLRIAYSGASPAEAQVGAQAFADVYLAYRSTKATSAADAQVARLKQQIDSTSKVLTDTSTALANEPENSPNALLLQQQVQAYASQLAQLQIESSAVATGSRTAGEVITPAALPAAPSGLPAPLLLAGALGLGLGLGVVLALWREHADTRVRDINDVPALGVGHVLGVVPIPDPGAQRDRAGDEAYRRLRTAVLAELRGERQVVCIAGATDDIDVAVVAAELANAVRRTDRQVTLVLADPDARVPGVEVPSGPGLTDLLQESSPQYLVWPEAIRTVHGLQVFGPGSSPGSIGDLYQSHALKLLLSELSTTVDLVLLVAPAITGSTGQALAFASDAVVLTVALGRTTHDELLNAAEEAEQLHVRMLGVAVVATLPRHRLLRRWAKIPATPLSTPRPPEAEPKIAAERDVSIDQSDQSPMKQPGHARQSDGVDEPTPVPAIPPMPPDPPVRIYPPVDHGESAAAGRRR